jgi:hypothetical protein
MSLRIRRGPDSDRQVTLFDAGEIIYTTDTKKLYIGDGSTTGGVHVLANSVGLGSGLAFNTGTQTIGFNLASLSLSTQITPESYTTTYTASGSSNTTLKVASTVGIQEGMTIAGTGFTTQTVTGVVDTTTLTISGNPGNSPSPTNGETLTFNSTNQYFTSSRMLTALNAALSAGTQSGISFAFNAGALSATVASSFPANAIGALTNNGTGTLSWTNLANYATLTSPTFTSPSLGAAVATSITPSITTFNLANTVATTVNFAGAATTLNIGASGGSATFAGNIAVNNSVTAAITTTSATANIFNAVATTVNIAGAATAVSIGGVSGTTTVNNNLTVSGNLTVNGTTTTVNQVTISTSAVVTQGVNVAGSYTGTYSDGLLLDYVTGNARISAGSGDGFTFYNNTGITRTQLAAITSNGNLSFTGSTISTSSTSLNVFNAVTTTINAFGAATTLNLGVTGGTTTINGHLAVEGVASTGATGTGSIVFATAPTINTPAISTGITTGSTSFNLVNTTATTVNVAGAATTISMGANTGTTTINNQLSLPLGLTTSAVAIVTTASPFAVFNTNATTINAYGAATTVNEGAPGITKYLGQATGNTTLSLLGNTGTGTVTITSNVTTGTANIFAGVTGTINIGGNGNLLTNAGYYTHSINNTVSAAGTSSQSAATALTKDINILTTVAANSGVALPTGTSGMIIYVYNSTSTAALVYPVSGGSAKINALTANAGFSLAANTGTRFLCSSATQWWAF